MPVSVVTAVAQSTHANPDDGSPYGGVPVVTGSAGPVEPVPAGALPPSGTACPTGDPCVLTGQNERYRTSTNVNETTLANFSDASNFGVANFYQLTSTPPSGFSYEPVVAQPLYATDVPQVGGGTRNVGPTSVFPSVYTNYDALGAPLGPSCDTAPCDHGDNWAVNQGGIWMSSKGPSSDYSANVYIGAGNGPFACTGSGTSLQCTNPSNVSYWGQSAAKLPAATSGASPSMGVPGDFFAPYVQRYTTNMTTGDSSPASYQTEELSRMDLDFATSGIVLIPHGSGVNIFSVTSDKSGYLYTMPAGSNSMGLFHTGDAGLTGGTVNTQTPFQASRLPTTANQTVCPINNSSTGKFSSTPCDEIHELAWFNDLMFVWPVNESVEVFQGSLTNSNNTYSFGTTPVYDPCLTSGNCTGTTPPFPPSNQNSEGPGMALAADSSNDATLWAIVPQHNSAGATTAGTLYAYTVNSNGSLTHIWDNVTGHNCSSPPATGWLVPSFTEPTLANGAVYVPTYCSVTNGGHYATCSAAASAGGVASGIIVFTTCP